jgi:hypothetical protein
MRGFFDREAGKHAKLDDSGQIRVDLLQALEGLMQPENKPVVRRGNVCCFIDWYATLALPSFARAMAAGVIDQDPAHDLGGHTKKMRSIPPVDLTLVEDAEVHLMDEGCCLQGVIGTFVSELAPRDMSELCIDDRQQLMERGPFAATPIMEERRNVG